MSRRARRAVVAARERRHATRKAAAAEREERTRLAEARRQWKRLGPTAQFELACEIVDTRATELKRAYAAVLSVAAGNSRYRRARASRPAVWREPAVTFLVARKWSSTSKARRPDAVPPYLWAYATVDGERRLCAVPTDVEDAREYRLEAQSRARIVVTPPDGAEDLQPIDGAITCLVALTPRSRVRYAMSCRHVFGLALSAPAVYPANAAVSREDVATGAPVPPVLARSHEIYGLLEPGGDGNFDVALARLSVDPADPALLDAIEALAPFDGQRYVDGHRAIRELGEYAILTPRGEKRATYVRGWSASEQVPVKYGALGSLRQGVLVIESMVSGGGTSRGDSGSPVVTHDRTQLVGMHFAGFDRTSYMIPAYELVRRRNFVGLADGEPLLIG